ncbi:hypothetical protein GQ53DRAFT_333710 [Thozetella sp. PMI_491]|nr:hypothetical protein GQ53DRAFT_333710 [Thozetella sp. PMI_491]
MTMFVLLPTSPVFTTVFCATCQERSPPLKHLRRGGENSSSSSISPSCRRASSQPPLSLICSRDRDRKPDHGFGPISFLTAAGDYLAPASQPSLWLLSVLCIFHPCRLCFLSPQPPWPLAYPIWKPKRRYGAPPSPAF